MPYRVINSSTGEIRAELADKLQAIDLAEQLATEVGFQEKFIVVKIVTIHETPIVPKK